MYCNLNGDELTTFVNQVTGWNVSVEDIVKTGERIFTMMRLLNLKLGYDTSKEKLPTLITRPLEGPTEEHVPDIEEQLKTWYDFRGWDRKSGRPPVEKLKSLELDDLA